MIELSLVGSSVPLRGERGGNGVATGQVFRKRLGKARSHR
jgi:hypothetical protein